MTTRTDTNTGGAPPVHTLNSVLGAVKGRMDLKESRRRDLCSSVRRVAFLLGDEPGHIVLDVPVIGAKLAVKNSTAAGLTNKRIITIKSDFMAAVAASRLRPVQRENKTPLSAGWKKFIAELATKREHFGLSRFARWCSGNRIEPTQVTDDTLQDFINGVRDRTLHRKPNELHRKVALIWNEAVHHSRLELQCVGVPTFRRPAKRIDWTRLPARFQKDVGAFLTWCAGVDPYAANARTRALAPHTVKLRQNQIHAAATALLESGINPKAVRSLRDLVSLDNVKRILRRRNEMVGGAENAFNHDLARTLVEIARGWVKVRPTALDKLKQLASRVPTPVSGLTRKNKTTLRQFDDPANLRRLYAFSRRLWAEVKRDTRPSVRSLVKAQAALAVGILCYIPLRPQNLSALKFDEHLFLHEGRNAISSLELPAHEVKNRIPLSYDVPPHVAKMLIEYRNRLAPAVIGRRPDRLFVKADGAAKDQWAVAWLIRSYLRKRAGLQLSGHQFRHLAAKVILDSEPGNFETPRQLLGHRSQRTTVNAYAGISSRRAARHHQHLIERALAEETPRRSR